MLVFSILVSDISYFFTLSSTRMCYRKIFIKFVQSLDVEKAFLLCVLKLNFCKIGYSVEKRGQQGDF